MKKVFLIFGLAVLGLGVFGLNVHADGDGVTARVLNRGIGIRPQSLGGAYVAIAEDGHAAHWNPAGLANENAFNLHWASVNLRGDSTPDSNDNLSFSVWRFGMSFWDQSVLEGNRDSPKISAWTVGFGTKVTRGLNLGINFKQAERNKERGWGLDVGSLIDIAPEVSVGIVGSNLIGPEFDNAKVAPVGKVGVAYRPFKDILTVALQGDWSEDTEPVGHIGIEGNIKGTEAISAVSLRGGYELSGEETSNATGGIELKFGGFFSIDYGATYPLEGDDGTKNVLQNHLGFSLKFGGKDREYIFQPEREYPSEGEVEEDMDDSNKKEWVF